MNRVKFRFLRLTLASAAGIACLLVSDNPAQIGPDALVSQANAWIGRPLTPMSYAGVARRTTRRAVYAGAAVGAAAVAAPVYMAPTVYTAPGCIQRVDAYGRIYYQCP
jgi:hypothetical protein